MTPGMSGISALKRDVEGSGMKRSRTETDVHPEREKRQTERMERPKGHCNDGLETSKEEVASGERREKDEKRVHTESAEEERRGHGELGV